MAESQQNTTSQLIETFSLSSIELQLQKGENLPLPEESNIFSHQQLFFLFSALFSPEVFPVDIDYHQLRIHNFQFVPWNLIFSWRSQTGV
jgi:hypothetical protein